MDLVCVTIDCATPAAVVSFWSEALRWRDVRVAPDGSGAVCRSPVGGTYLEFIRVPEGKRVKNRLHLGCTAGDLNRLDDEIARLVELGAAVAWEEEFPTEVAAVYRNVVLRDVEGNEFCLGAGHMPSASPADDIVVRDAWGRRPRMSVEPAQASRTSWRTIHESVAESLAAARASSSTWSTSSCSRVTPGGGATNHRRRLNW